MIVEIGIKLDKNLDYYEDIIKNAGGQKVFSCETRDLYWSNKSFENLTENQIKKSCIRIRICKKLDKDTSYSATVDNYKVFDIKKQDKFSIKLTKIKKFEKLFTKKCWKQVFDTTKTDYHYVIGDMKSRIQLQEIQDIGLILYYDNPDYYHMPASEQRLALIRELNNYGFKIKQSTLGLDKLRTLYCKKEMYSDNQNG